MGLKTILVHCADEGRYRRLLAPAIELARTFESHLVGLSVMPPVLIQPALVPGGVATIVESHRKAYESSRAAMKAGFEDSVRRAGISAEWCDADANHGKVWRKVLDHGRSADLIVASEADAGWSYSELMEAPVDLVLNAGRPVLLIPNAGEFKGPGRKILVAWNGSRESARAVFDALPLLKRAEKTTVLWINPGRDPAAEDVPGADLCTSLARHGVVCEAAMVDRPDDAVGETLMRRARETGADLVVMGCYGHSRLRELVVGGATREVLRRLSVPLLMSH